MLWGWYDAGSQTSISSMRSKHLNSPVLSLQSRLAIFKRKDCWLGGHIERWRKKCSRSWSNPEGCALASGRFHGAWAAVVRQGQVLHPFGVTYMDIYFVVGQDKKVLESLVGTNFGA